MIGAPDGEQPVFEIERPARMVSFAKPFAAARHAVTFEQFDAFVSAKKHVLAAGCNVDADDRWIDKPELSYRVPGFAQTPQHPVVCVAYPDATAYVAWLTETTGKPYRLLAEAEREYITRAGTTTAYFWGNQFDPARAAHDTRRRPLTVAKGAAPVLSRYTGTVPVQSFQPNAWGFFNVHGNVIEWTQDCWNRTLVGLPTDGGPAVTGDCTRRVLRGSGWSFWPVDLRSAYRAADDKDSRFVHVGFRVARDLIDGKQ